MPGSLVSSVQARTSGGTTASASLSPTPSAGHLVVVQASIYDTAAYPTASDNQGNTYTARVSAQNPGDANHRVRIFDAQNVATGSPFTVTVSSGDADSKCAYISAWSGMATASAHDAGANATNTGTSTSPAVTSGALAQAASVVFATHNYFVAATTTPPGSPWVLIGEEEDTSFTGHSSVSQVTSATSAVTATWSLSSSGGWAAVATAYKSAAATVEQEGFRWRADDGSESAASWLAAQDTNITRMADTPTRLRTLLNATGDPASFTPQLEYKLSSDSTYIKVPTSTAISIAHGATGSAPTLTTQTSTVDVPFPAGIQAGDLLLLSIASRLGSTAIDAETGWTLLNSANVATSEGTAGTEGADAGGVRVTVFYKIADGTETGNVTVANAGTATLSKTGSISRYTKPGWATWDLASTTGKDVAGGTAYSAAMAADPGIAVGDILFVATALNGDTANWGSQDVTGTGLASALTAERAENLSSGGNDVELVTTEHDVTAALTSGVPTFVATGSAGTLEGASVLVRLRATGTPAFQMAASSDITASGENTTAQLTPPSGKTTSDFDAGRIGDDENPLDAVDLTADDYSELEWCVQANGAAVSAGQVYQFRVTAAGTALSTYTVTPQWTIASPAVDIGVAAGALAMTGRGVSMNFTINIPTDTV